MASGSPIPKHWHTKAQVGMSITTTTKSLSLLWVSPLSTLVYYTSIAVS